MESLEDFVEFVMGNMMLEDSKVFSFFFLEGFRAENELDVFWDLTGQPELWLYAITLEILILINPLNDDDCFGYFLSAIAQILLFNMVRDHIKPIFKIPPQFLFIDIHLLLYLKHILNNHRHTRNSIIIL